MNSNFIQQYINHKINTITPNELVQLANSQGIQISKQEASQVIAIVRSEKIDITNTRQIKRLLAKIKREVNPRAMKQTEKLLAAYYNKLTDA